MYIERWYRFLQEGPTMTTWQLSGFADEASDDLDEQITLLRSLQLVNVDFRSAWGTNVLALTDEQVDLAASTLSAAGVSVAALGSPIGKISVHDDFESHLRKMERAVQIARRFGTKSIRLFSFFIPATDDPALHRNEVLRRMSALVAVAEREGIMALHENEKDIYGDTPERCVDLVESVGSENLRLILDPANFVQCGVAPVSDAYGPVRPYLHALHMKDAVAATGEVCVTGAGDAQIRELVRLLHADGFEGVVSLEPHLGRVNAFGAQCGPELWASAHRAFVELLDQEGVRYS